MRKADGGEAIKGTWATGQGSRRTGVAMKADAHGHKPPRARSVTKDFRSRSKRRLRAHGSEEKSQYFFKISGTCPRTRVLSIFAHPAASDDEESFRTVVAEMQLR
jgi:hypothetical protein